MRNSPKPPKNLFKIKNLLNNNYKKLKNDKQKTKRFKYPEKS